MAHPTQDDSNRYMTDMLNLSLSLDAAITQDDPEGIAEALIQGKQQYFDLVARRFSFEFDRRQAGVVLWMLDMIQARLAELARMQYEKSFPAGVPDGSEPGAIPMSG